jgi:hypothetical protein
MRAGDRRFDGPRRLLMGRLEGLDNHPVKLQTRADLPLDAHRVRLSLECPNDDG